MRFLYCILPLLGAVTLASDLTSELTSELTADKCQCPLVKCTSKDTFALCTCINARETQCKKNCPDYKPRFIPCPKPVPSPTLKPVSNPKPTHKSNPKPKPKPTPKPASKPTSQPKTCECPLVNCLQGPGLCACVNTAAQSCHERCGGPPPKPQSCTAEEIVARAQEPETQAEAECECEGVFCVQSFPESCYCANAAAQACYSKCGGVKPNLQDCPPQSSSSLVTKTRTRPKHHKTTTCLTKPVYSTPTPPLLPPNPYMVCGGGRAGIKQCDAGYICITDPYTPGCGPACDALGICVPDEMCGGFAGFKCPRKGEVCHDDPRDDCDAKAGGADCAGLCVIPHRSLGEDL